MIHTIYSNSYEVLRAVLLNNIDALRLRPEAESLRAEGGRPDESPEESAQDLWGFFLHDYCRSAGMPQSP